MRSYTEDECRLLLQALKAACNEAIQVLVSRTGQTAAIWDRLMAAIVVAPAAQNDSAVGQYDISYQLAEIEVKLWHVAPHPQLGKMQQHISWQKLRNNTCALHLSAYAHGLVVCILW